MKNILVLNLILIISCCIIGCHTSTGCHKFPPREPIYLDSEFDATEINNIAILKPNVYLRQSEPEFSVGEFIEALTTGLIEKGYSYHLDREVPRNIENLSEASPEIIKNIYDGKERWILISSINIHREWGEPTNVDPRGKATARHGNKIVVIESSVCWVISIECCLLDDQEGKFLWADGGKVGPIQDGYAVELRRGIIRLLTAEVIKTLPETIH